METKNVKERLYLSGWGVNSYKIINKLAELVKQEKGEIITEYKELYNKNDIILIKNRNIDTDIIELTDKIEKATNNLKNNEHDEETTKKIKEYIEKNTKELNELKAINNDFIELKYKNYLTFIIDNFVYYIQLDENPYFPWYIIKKPAEINENGEIITRYNYYMEDLKKDFIETYDNIQSFYEPTNDKQITEIATRLLNQVKNRKCCEIVTSRKRVNNIYNNSYHFETIKEDRKKTYYII